MLAFDGCNPGAIRWIEEYFRDCVYDYRDRIGFTLGLCSILVWLTAQLPQFISNIKNQSSEALSIWFLVEWFAGDTLNLLGCLIQGQQLPTTTILAAYFVLMDVIMLLQYIYYGTLQARRKRLRARVQRRRQHAHHHTGSSGSHHHSRDSTQHPAPRRLQDGNTGALSPLPDAAAFIAKPAAQPPPQLSPNNTDGSAGRAAWRTTTAATATGLSIACLATLAAFHSATTPGAAGVGNLPSRRHLLLPYDASAQSSALPAQGGGAGGAAAAAVAAAAALLGGSPASADASGLDAAGAGAGSGSGSGSNLGSSSGLGCSFLNCDVALVAGTAMGYMSTCFYLASRVSQIRKNLARRSTEGLSAVMFVLTMTANLCTGVSIVVRLRSLLQLREQLPWMCGTFGTIALDATLLYQVLTLGPHGDHGHGHHGQGHGQQGHGHGQHGHSRRLSQGPMDGNGEGGKPPDLEAPLLAAAADGEGEGEGQESRGPHWEAAAAVAASPT